MTQYDVSRATMLQRGQECARMMAEKAESQPIAPKSIEEIQASRREQGLCRHCGGPIPCWSYFGDRKVGVLHTGASWRKARRNRHA